MTRFVRILYIVSLLLCFCFPSHAQDSWVRIRLTNGLVYEAKVEHQTEQIIVFQTVQGKRYQSLMSDIAEIEPIAEILPQEDNRGRKKSFGIVLHLNGGVAFRDSQAGWNAGGHLHFGAANVFDKRVFIGGGIGVDAFQVGGTRLFIPLTASVILPLMQTDDAPFVGLNGGYGFAVRGAQRGGFAGGVQIGWLHRFESQMAVMLAITGKLQQATLNVSEQIDGLSYDYSARRLISQIGLQFSLML